MFQDFGRYTGLTVADNVRVGDPQSGRQVADAIRAVGLQVADPTQMLGKAIGGTELSIGQWQRLAIARGWFRQRELVVLDEPTSSLDPLAEAEIFRMLIELSGARTTLFVTHRIGTAALADRIAVFQAGRIVENGTHRELLASGGRYAAMHAAQAQWYRR